MFQTGYDKRGHRCELGSSLESFEIASYHAALQWASLLSYAYHVSLLQETLDEEVRADGRLRDIERGINLAAMAV